MKILRFSTILLSTIVSLGFGVEGKVQCRIPSADSSLYAKTDSGGIAIMTYNPAVALAASMAFPGEGHFYTGHYFKGLLYLAAEVGVGIFGYTQYVQASWLKHNADSAAALAAAHRNWTRPAGDTTMIDSAFYFKLDADGARMEEKEVRNVVYQSLAWMAGIYYYNVLDALQCTNLFKNDAKKSPATAMWLSAIPGLGLGQIYNGELSKAGMIFMVQANMAYLAVNYHLIMTECEKYEAAIDPSDKARYGLFNGAQRDRWENRRTTAFRNRNMWIWYSLAFYLYGIFDAAVDAHLHDAGVKMKLEPDLSPGNKEVGLRATFDF
jgi:hypothetical protein